MSQLQQQARALGDPTRHEIFQFLVHSDQPVGVRELAIAAGVHPNAVRQHLTKLVEADLVLERPARPSGRGRPRLLYSVSPGAESRWGARGPYERLSMWLSEMLRSGDAPEEVGRRAARAHLLAHAPDAFDRADPLDSFVEGLSREGFAPEVEGSPDQLSPRAGHAAGDPDALAGLGETIRIRLGNCPYASAVDVAPDAVCRFHLGFVEGLAEAGGAAVVVDELVPADPHSGGCLLRCRMADPIRGAHGRP